MGRRGGRKKSLPHPDGCASAWPEFVPKLDIVHMYGVWDPNPEWGGGHWFNPEGTFCKCTRCTFQRSPEECLAIVVPSVDRDTGGIRLNGPWLPYLAHEE